MTENITERDVHFEIVYLGDNRYAVDMPCTDGTTARVFIGRLTECLDFIRSIT